MKENNKSSKSTKIIFILFIVLCLGAVAFSIKHILSNNNVKTIPFTSDGYVIKYNSGNNKQEVITFNSGNNYSYKKTEDVSFNKNIISNDLVAHYQNGNILVFKNIVGLDLITIDQPIILYYNIFKNTTIEKTDDGYVVKTFDDKKVNFNKLLLRISENKYLLLSDTIRLTTNTNEIIEFDDYVYFEYLDGSVISIYNDSKTYKTIFSNTIMVADDISIYLSEKEVYKKEEKFITLTNLVLDMDSNIDLIPTEIIENEVEIKTADKPSSNGAGTSVNNNTSGGNAGTGNEGNTPSEEGEEGQEEETVIEVDVYKEPKFKVTELSVTTVNLNAAIEIVDDDSLITSGTLISIVENSNSKTVYSTETVQGDLNLRVSYANLKPDTEYTLYARTNFKVDEIEYSKNFVAKIFRTEALGVSIRKGYAKADSLEIDVIKENFSRVSQCTLYIYEKDGTLITSAPIDFADGNRQSILFDSLDNNTTYMIKLGDIVSNGILISDGYSIKENMQTLKVNPTISTLKYAVDKANSQFNIGIGSVQDPDYGIKSYRYEIFDARQDMENEDPIITFDSNTKENIAVKVDDVKINRGVAYTYRVIATFFDNDKNIEIVKELGSNMQLDGVKFPDVRFEETYITWEQINGTLIIRDDSHAIVSDKFKVVYKNSLGAYTSQTLTMDTSTNTIPININNLRANETYTFDIFTSLDLQDGNGISETTYIGSVEVQTKEPQPLMTSFNNFEDFKNVFAVNFQVQNPDAELEANTLSEMKISIYEGTTTNGTPIVSKTVVDTNDDPYQSTLKEEYYDNYKTITPEFFGSDVKNKNFTGKTYTMQVTSTYDYTSYKNEIPIQNNTFTFLLNGILPSLPEDQNNAIDVLAIPNRSATTYGLEDNPDLQPATIIAYEVQADFVDTSKTSSECEYKVYVLNPNTGNFEHLDSLDRTLPMVNNGIAPKTVYLVGEGTSDALDTDMLRRGNTYYITYRIKMEYDLNGDGTPEDVYYPEVIKSGTVLKSKDMVINKQSADVLLYPSSSTETSSTWSYKIKDIDKSFASVAFEDDKEYAYIDLFTNNSSQKKGSQKIYINQNEYNTITFDGLSKSDIMAFKYEEKKLKTANVSKVSLTNQYFYGSENISGISYNIKTVNNQLFIEFPDYITNLELYQIIAYFDVKIHSANKEINLNKMKIDSASGAIVINLYDIQELIGETLSISLTAYYDTGNTGFDFEENDLVLVQEATAAEFGMYNTISGNLVLTPNIQADKTYVFTGFERDNAILHVGGNALNVTINKDGILYKSPKSSTKIVLKKVSTAELSSSDTFRFDYVVPQINMYKEDGSFNITPLIDQIIANCELEVDSHTNIKDDKIYIELYKTDSSGKNEEYVRTYEFGPIELKPAFSLDNLEFKTNYFIRYYVYIEGYSQKFYLYDVVKEDVGIKYHFSTLADAEITDFKAELKGSSYNTKKLEINYKLGITEGFEVIKYVLEKYNPTTDQYEEIGSIPESRSFARAMNVMANAAPGNGIYYGGKYKVKIKPVGYYESEGQKVQVELAVKEFTFTLPNSKTVSATVSGSSGNNSLVFSVALNNNDIVVVNDKYTTYLKDSSGREVEGSRSTNGNALISYQRFGYTTNTTTTSYKYISGLENGMTYTFYAIIPVDSNNDGIEDYSLTKTKSIKFGEEVNVGNMIASLSNTPNKVKVSYVDSYKTDSIKTFDYTITCYQGTNYIYLDSHNVQNFVLTVDDSSDNILYHEVALADRDFENGFIYYITMNYYDEVGNLLTQAEVIYMGDE